MRRTARNALALVAAGLAVEQLVVRRVRGRVDPQLDGLYDLPPDLVRHDVPTHDGGTVHVMERGSGRPLVLLHGVTLAAEIWSPLFHLLPDRYRVIAMDVRGHGRSVVGSEGVGRKRAARDLATVLTELDLHGAIVAGHSMGGMIVGEFCGDFPEILEEHVAGLAFVNTATADLVPARVREPMIAQARKLAEVTSRRPAPQLPKELNLVASRVAFGDRPSSKAVEQVSRLGLSVDPTQYMSLWVDLLDLDTRDNLAKARCPSVVLVGTKDRLTPPRLARAIEDALPDAELVVLEGAGHQIMQERPYELVAAVDRLSERISQKERA